MLSRSVMSNSFNPMDCSPPGSSVHGDSPGKNTGVGSHFLLQGIFPTQISNPCRPHCRQILYHLSYQGRCVQTPGPPVPTVSLSFPHPEIGLSGHLHGAAVRVEYSRAVVEKNQNHMCSEDGGPRHGWGGREEGGMHLAESALFIYLDPGLRLYIHCRFNSV